MRGEGEREKERERGRERGEEKEGDRTRERDQEVKTFALYIPSSGQNPGITYGLPSTTIASLSTDSVVLDESLSVTQDLECREEAGQRLVHAHGQETKEPRNQPVLPRAWL